MIKRTKTDNELNTKITFIWLDDIELTTECKVNLKTKEVYDIKNSHIIGNNKGYVEINKVKYPVCLNLNPHTTNMENCDGFWYTI